MYARKRFLYTLPCNSLDGIIMRIEPPLSTSITFFRLLQANGSSLKLGYSYTLCASRIVLSAIPFCFVFSTYTNIPTLRAPSFKLHANAVVILTTIISLVRFLVADKPAESKSSIPSAFFAGNFLRGTGPLLAGAFSPCSLAAFFAATLACKAAASFSFRFRGSPPYYRIKY